MAGKRRIDIDLMAAKADILHDIVADTISSEIRRETGIECTARENTEIRVNLLKVEQLIKKFDLNNKDKEVLMYDPYFKPYNPRGLNKLAGIDYYNENKK